MNLLKFPKAYFSTAAATVPTVFILNRGTRTVTAEDTAIIIAAIIIRPRDRAVEAIRAGNNNFGLP